MKFQAKINIMPKREILDPQGKTVGKNLPKVGVEGVENVRIGKRIELEVEAGSENEAREKVDLACRKLLVNQIMEDYDFRINKLEQVEG